LAAIALALAWRVRRTGLPLMQAVNTLFQDTLMVGQKSSPRVIEVSDAAAKMARSVEQLGASRLMVRASGEAFDGPLVAERGPINEASIRLELARAQSEYGQRDAALASLRQVLKLGTPVEQDEAHRLVRQLDAAAS
jgi:FimV-like protein